MGTAVAGYGATSDLIVRFRSGYLKAIAKAWEDETFLNSLCEQENILAWDEFVDLLPGKTELPWTAHIEVKFDAAGGPQWAPGPTAGWIGPNDHFIIQLPPAPEDESEFPIALAEYFQQFPTLMGYKYDALSQEETGEEAAEYVGDGSAADFVNFGSVMLQAIALSWSSETAHEGNGRTFREELIAEGMATLSRFFGYQQPLELQFQICGR